MPDIHRSFDQAVQPKSQRTMSHNLLDLIGDQSKPDLHAQGRRRPSPDQFYE